MHLWNNAELVALVCPAGVIVLVDGEDSRLEVVCAAEVLVEGKADDGCVCLHVDTLGLCRSLLGHLDNLDGLLVDGADSAYSCELGCAVHRPSEDVEEDEEEDEAKEDYAHAHEGHGNAVWVFLLELFYLVVVRDLIGRAWCYAGSVGLLPLCPVLACPA